MPGTIGSLEGAIDTYSRSLIQMWFLPWNIYQTVKGATILQSTVFTADAVPGAGDRHRPTLSKPLAPGIPYARLDEAVPKSAVHFIPSMLKPGDPTFRFQLEGDVFHSLPGATYLGEVTIVDDDRGQQVGSPVKIWMVVS